jgi:ubiquinone/menaquinone biosynthesis C-methylase UbiE
MPRLRTYLLLAGATAATVAVVRHRMSGGGVEVPGGIVMADAARYDSLSGRLLAGFYASVAADVAAVAPSGGRVLEIGAGPGHLTARLAADHGLEVTALDLDPIMVEHARANAERDLPEAVGRPAFVAADAAAMPFPDDSFDVVVSTLSMHHWADKAGAQAEIARVLRVDGRALIWDIRPGVVPLHMDVPDPLAAIDPTVLEIVSAAPWSWPWRLRLTQRFELRRPTDADGEPVGGAGVPR